MPDLTAKQITELAKVFQSLGTARGIIRELMFPENPNDEKYDSGSVSIGKVIQCSNCGLAIEDGVVIACPSTDSTLKGMCRECADERLK